MPEVTTAAGPARKVDFLAWTLRLLVALIFLSEGLDKFSSSRLWAFVFARIGFGSWFRYATGVIEIACALLLLIPRATVIAVPMLMCTMIGALLVHFFIIGIGPQTVLVTLLLGALLVIGWRQRGRLANS